MSQRLRRIITSSSTTSAFIFFPAVGHAPHNASQIARPRPEDCDGLHDWRSLQRRRFIGGPRIGGAQLAPANSARNEIFEEYLRDLRKFAAGEKTEHTDRRAMENLLIAFTKQTEGKPTVQHEPKRTAGKGRSRHCRRQCSGLHD